MSAAQKPLGSFVIMLHSHLPYYRKAGMWPFGEENLYECIAETYLPLLNALFELKDEGIQAKINVGITPILAEQLADSYLQQGFVTYIEKRLEAVAQDVARYPDPEVPHSEHLAFLARWYQEHLQSLLNDFNTRYQRNLLAGFRALQEAGCVEITTSAATHGFLPLLGSDEAIQHQVKMGVETYRRHFGQNPKGVWLPECAYRPSKTWTDVVTGEIKKRPAIESFLYENGLEYFFTEYQAIEGSKASKFRRDFGVYKNTQFHDMPLNGSTQQQKGLTTDEAYWMKDYPVAVMGRNERASFQVWSAAHGYPGDGLYREFHKKDSNSGMHYWRITSKECDFFDKMLYDPVQALEKAEDHARHYAGMVHTLLEERYQATGRHNLLMVSFDTELYGHWWFEGVHWLKHVIRNLHQDKTVQMQTGSEYLSVYPPRRAIDLPESTWGAGGHFWVWDNPNTSWMWPVIHAKEAKMQELAQKYSRESDALTIRLLNQAARELLLLEGSDWPFLVTTFQAKDYAIERFQQHCDRFDALVAMLEGGKVDVSMLHEMEDTDNCFPNENYHWYAYQPQVTNESTPSDAGKLEVPMF